MEEKTLYDYYTKRGQKLPAIEERAKSYEAAGLGKATDYISKNRAGDVAPNTAYLAYLQKQGATPTPAEATPAEAPAVVSGKQASKDIASRGGDPTKPPATTPDAFEQYKEKVKPTTPEPTTPSFEDRYKELRKEGGISDLEDQASELQKKQNLIKENLKAFARKEYEGQSLGFATGRVSEEQKLAQQELDRLQNEESLVLDRINTKNKNIETVMNLSKLDYTEARDKYEKEYTRNLSISSAVNAADSKETSDLKASYNTMFNMMKTSGQTWEDLPNDFKTNLYQMELKMGIPPGSFELLARSNPKAEIITQGTSSDEAGNEFAWVMTKDEKGIPQITKIGGTGGFKKPTGDATKDADKKAEYEKAEAYVKAHMDKSRSELESAIRKDKKYLSDGDIVAILDSADAYSKPISPAMVTKISDEIVKKVKGIFKSKEAEFEKAKLLIEQNKTKKKWTSTQVSAIETEIKKKLGIK